LTDKWPARADAAECVVLQDDLCRELRPDSFDLAIADATSADKHTRMKNSLAAAGRPAILINAEQHSQPYQLDGNVVELPRDIPQWAATAALLGEEILRRTLAESRARQSEQARSVAEAEATLGRYMVEMRNNVNNALTSVLGNAELLLHEPGLPAPVQAQADTIRNMALRLNEIFQRFSSIEKELNVAARESGKSPASSWAAAGAR
jgi:signal transduction histidine kinase